MKTAVTGGKTFDEIVTLIDELRGEADRAVGPISFMRAIIGNEQARYKINGSDSGRALSIAHNAVIHSVILFCNRAWEESHAEYISIPNLVKVLPNSDSLFEWCLARKTVSATQKGRQIFDARYERIMSEFASVSAHPAKPHLRALRSEYLSHRVFESRDRKNHIKKHGDLVASSHNQLVEFASLNVGLIGQLAKIIDGCAPDYEERIEKVRADCLLFWKLLPILSQAEHEGTL